MASVFDSLASRVQRLRRDPQRIVDFLRIPRPLVRSMPLMNKLGLQAARALKDQAVWRMRTTEVPDHLRGPLQTLEQDGFVVLENFFSASEFAALEEETTRIEALPPEQLMVTPYGPNYESKFFFVSKYGTQYPAFGRLVRDNDYLYDLARCVARRERSYRPHVVMQWVYKPDPHAPHQDYEYNSFLHVDRHYPFMKAFLYLRDVPEGCAPYTFVRGSHKFNWNRLRFEYLLGVRQSRVRTGDRSVNPNQKELDRIMEELARELRDREGLEEVPIVGKKNTLIISNNAGLHRRSEMTVAGTRVTANLDFKFFESPAQHLYPVLRHLESKGEVPADVSPW